MTYSDSVTRFYLHSVLGEDEGLHGRSVLVVGALPGGRRSSSHPLQQRHLLVDALHLLQGHAQPATHLEQVEATDRFIVCLA